MISLKKTYAEQLLQLALALSLLRADPDSFLGWNWESSRLALQNGGDGNDGWQLEMRTTPMSDYPYANRKHVMPRLIEDLIRFDPANSHDVTAYLLNVQRTDEGGAATSVEEAPVVNTTETDINLSSIINGGAPDEMDFFINSDQFLYSESILEQNIADLGDYARELNDLNFNAPYFALPMKDEPLDIDIPLYKVKEDPEEDQATASEVPWSSDHMRFNPPEIVIKREIKEEPDDERNSTSGVSSGSSSRSGNPGSRSTSECSTSSAMPIAGCSVKEDDFSEEESEIVEVLWKQDVDLGFTLTPSKEPQVKEQPANSSDDIEKIKALQDLENEKSNETLAKNVLDESDAWNGIQFTIDNETGEYIQLPLQLDELLQDVLQLGVLDAADDSEVKDISEDSLAETQDLVSFAESLEGDDLDILGENVELKTNDNTEQASATTTSIDQAAAETDTQLDKSGLDTPSFSDLENAANDLDELDMMIQSSGPFHHHHHPHSHLNHHHLNPLGNPHHPLSHLNHPHHVQAQHIAATSSAVPVNRMPNGQGYINSNAVISSNVPPNGGASGFRQTATSTYPHHPQSRVPPLSRGVSMEQRLQDIANLFNPLPGMGVGMGVGEMSSPYSHYPSHYPYQGAGPIPPPPTAGAGSQHTQFAPHVLHDINVTGGAGGQPHYGPNLGTAVSSSMHLTNSSHEAEGGATGYKMDHDLMYYSNTSSELNHTTDGFINSILNDEDLQLMDMGVNESFYTMRMLDNNATSNNSSVLSGGASSNGLLSSAMSLSTNGNQTNTANGATGTTNTANGDRLDASSDSAVSSMGSERVPSLSDSEWGDAGSDSAQDYHHHGGGGKYGGASGGPYDYSRHQPPVAQKKHQMFGKRFLNHQDVQGGGAIGGPLPNIEQNPVKYEYEPYGTLPMEGAVGLNGKSSAISTIPNPSVPLTPAEMKYSCSLDFARTSMVHHNHTYTLSPESNGATPRPQTRDKKLKKMSSGGNNSSSLSVQEDEHLTRDEKRARALNIPMPVHEIINLPMDEFNERLSKYDLSESQLSLIRDIRRRGKNKVAAQNCRKRKLDQILSLADEVKEMRRQKDRLLRDRELALSDRSRIRKKFAALHQHIFQHLRDPDGNLYSSSQYSLQQSADGTVFLLPREKPDGSSNGNSSSSGNNSSSSSMNGTHQHHQHHHQHPHHPKE